MNRGGLCDVCLSPGACCRDLTLYRKDGALLTVWDDEGPATFTSEHDLPFDPIGKVGQWTDPEGGREYSAWNFRCRALGDDGRCTIYENRPKLCADYLPGSSPLCVHYHESDQ